jgi:hypothetical protein
LRSKSPKDKKGRKPLCKLKELDRKGTVKREKNSSKKVLKNKNFFRKELETNYKKLAIQ